MTTLVELLALSKVGSAEHDAELRGLRGKQNLNSHKASQPPVPRESALCRLRRQRTSTDVLIMPILSASDCQNRGVRACCEARRPSAVSAPKTQRGPPSSWIIFMVSAEAPVELLPQAKWVCASTAQKTTSRFDCALRVLMLRHDHPWPRVQRQDGSGTAVKAHADKHGTNEITAFQKSVPSAAQWPTRPLRGESMLTRSHCFVHHIKQLCGVLPA